MPVFQKNIYQVWFQGKDNLKNSGSLVCNRRNFLENINNWELLNKDWNYFCLDDKDLQKACNLYSLKCYNAYKIAKTMHTKIDLGKIVMIYLYGGIMVDIDMYILRSLNSSKNIRNFINEYNKNGKHNLGISKFNSNFLESFISCGYLEFYNNAMIISTPRNPMLKIYIDIIIKNIYNNEKANILPYLYVQKTTGPIVFNNFIQKYAKKSNLTIFDYTLFEPCNANNQCTIRNNTIAIHNYEMSWMPKSIKQILIFYYNYWYYFILIVFIIIYLCRTYFLCKF